jgi:hypothetical protein
MCLNNTNLRYLSTLAKGDLRKLKRSMGSDKMSQREAEVRHDCFVHATRRLGSESLLNKVLFGKRRSDSSDEALINDFKSFDQPFHPVPRDYHYLRALRVTEKIFRPSRVLHPIHFTDLRYYPWTKNTSAEAPYNFETKWKTELQRMQAEGEIEDAYASFHNLEDRIFIDNRSHIHKIKDGHRDFWNEDGSPRPYYFTTLHSRAHVVDNDEPDKIRAVFGVPKLLLMAEQTFIWPLMAHYLNKPTNQHPFLWGNEIMKGGWKNLYRQVAKPSRHTYLSLDWSEFDKRALHEVIDDVHIMWKSWFDLSRYEPTVFYPFASTSEERLNRLWKWTTDMIKHYPILQPDGKLYQWQHNGIASGFQQTQILDSFVNTIMLLTTLSANGINIESK